MIRVGFIGAVSTDWMGGLNYYKNLLYALAKRDDKSISPVVFVGKQTDSNIKEMFSEYAEVIEHSMFDKKSLLWYVWKIGYKYFKTSYLVNRICVEHNIDILSHSGMVGLKNVKTINWIPDFQHIHLPEMFSSEEIEKRDANFLTMIKDSDRVIVSSYDALKDLNTINNNYGHKVNVLQFVSQPNNAYFTLNDIDKKKLIEKYTLPEDFYYIPNQFWKHKNHMLVLEAIKYLKDKDIWVNIVFTGHMEDYRNKTHMDKIREYIVLNHLEDRVMLLGLIDYEDVFSLMKFSKAVINPSLFEGWSSTVEECKSIGKNMILSDLNVHVEQCPEAQFFDRSSYVSLANALQNYSFVDEKKEINIKERTENFASNYIAIVKEVINDNR